MYFKQEIQGTIIDKSIYEASFVQAQTALEALKKEFQEQKLPFFSLLADDQDLVSLQPLVDKFQKFETVVVLGTGGSSLGGQTLCELKQTKFSKRQQGPQVHFMDNIDPYTFKEFFQSVSLETTGFIVISKSGSTAETLCQFLVVLEAFQERGLKSQCQDHFIVITEPKASPLRSLADQYSLPCLDHPLTIGGRFSVFSVVGSLPALIAGIDVKKVRQGALTLVSETLNAPLKSSVALMAASLRTFEQEKSINSYVFMPYIDRLYSLSLWFRQLWAESLGKEGKGILPAHASGTVDQHSQLQLYLQGPKDKFFTLVCLNYKKQGRKVNADSHDKRLDYLYNKTMGDLLVAEQNATLKSLVNQGCVVRTLHLEQLNEEVLGALLAELMLETLLMAKLMAINPFDQPAVEESKILTRHYLKEAS
jgi:glucose-6-phosphate isomerase